MPHRNQKIFDEGWQAWTDGYLSDQNPYVPQGYDGDDWSAWLDGFNAAEEDHEEREAERDEIADRGDHEFHRDHDQ